MRPGREVAAVRGVLASVLGMIRDGATHIAVATDHVIESFRNELWPGYKTSAGVEPELLAQFPLLEEALSAAGVVVWPMVEFEADDALAAAAVVAARDSRVERVIICTPDKDLAQCVCGARIVQLNRRTRVTLDEPAVVQKFGVSPASIPDYLALVGDAADGYYNTTGIDIAGSIRQRPQIVGYARFNGCGGFNPNRPLQMIGRVFECAEPCVWQGQNKLLYDPATSPVKVPLF